MLVYSAAVLSALTALGLFFAVWQVWENDAVPAAVFAVCSVVTGVAAVGLWWMV